MRELLRLVLRLMGQVYVSEEFPELGKEALEVWKLRHQIEVVLDKGYYNATLTDLDVRELLSR